LRAKMDVSLMRQFRAMAARVANSTAFLLSTGAPGHPQQTGQTFVFGGSEARRARTEDLRRRQKLDVDFQSDDGLELRVGGDGFLGGAGHEVEIIKGSAAVALSAKPITAKGTKVYEGKATDSGVRSSNCPSGSRRT
jgi:hypothetical protein